MLVKVIVILMMLAILVSLGSALFFLVKNGSDSKRVIRSLTWRIGLSLTLFILLMVGFAFGFITPHSL